MAFIAAAIIGGASALGAGALSAYGNITASQQQQQGLQQALGAQQQMFKTARGALQPFISQGQGVGSTLQGLLTPGPNQNALLSQLPGFQFAQYWGQQAARNQGTTLGLGGNTLTAAADYATGKAQEYWGQDVNALQNFYNTGANAAGSLAGNAAQFSGQIGQTLGGIGQAQAAGTLGATNAGAQALMGGANAIGNYALLSKIFSPGGIYGPKTG